MNFKVHILLISIMFIAINTCYAGSTNKIKDKEENIYKIFRNEKQKRENIAGKVIKLINERKKIIEKKSKMKRVDLLELLGEPDMNLIIGSTWKSIYIVSHSSYIGIFFNKDGNVTEIKSFLLSEIELTKQDKAIIKTFKTNIMERKKNGGRIVELVKDKMITMEKKGKMGKLDVLELLGNPTRKSKDDCVWQYSVFYSSFIDIFFDKKGNVTKIVSCIPEEGK